MGTRCSGAAVVHRRVSGVMGYRPVFLGYRLDRRQVIDDVLDRYEAHLALLTLTADTDTASVLTPSMPAQDPTPPVPRDADDIQDLRE